MSNISSIIKSQNRKILSKKESKSSKPSCNCRDKTFHPLNGNCLQQNVKYYSKVIPRNKFTNKTIPHYIGLTECSLKDRLRKQKNSFKYVNKRNAAEFSNFIWDQQNKNIDASLRWSILDKAKLYSSGSRNCLLCLTEKYHILFLGLNLFNKRNELVSKSRRKSKYYTLNYKRFPSLQVAKLDYFLFKVLDIYTASLSLNFEQKVVQTIYITLYIFLRIFCF